MYLLTRVYWLFLWYLYFITHKLPFVGKYSEDYFMFKTIRSDFFIRLKIHSTFPQHPPPPFFSPPPKLNSGKKKFRAKRDQKKRIDFSVVCQHLTTVGCKYFCAFFIANSNASKKQWNMKKKDEASFLQTKMNNKRSNQNQQKITT